MSSSTGTITASAADVRVSASRIPLYFFAIVVGATCITIGILWDISWHATIGRDTFWTPAHLAIHAGGLLAGLSSAGLIFKTTFFGTEAERAASVSVWGMRGPIGAWICVWGALAMLTSAPFDDWWHNAYGLDVKILSPPHTVLAAGMHCVVMGAVLQVLSLQNRGADAAQAVGRWLFIYVAGVAVVLAAIIITEYSLPNMQRGARFYQVASWLYPIVLIPVARAARVRWAATSIAAVYMLVMMAVIWILPLFAAQPMLAPIYNPVDHMVPPAFPVLLVIPALGIDLVMRWVGVGRGWLWDTLLAAMLAAVFLGLLLAVQWYFSAFLLSPASDNWFFAGQGWWSYSASPGKWRSEFWYQKAQPLTWKSMGIAFGVGLISSRIALTFGNWMAKVKR